MSAEIVVLSFRPYLLVYGIILEIQEYIPIWNSLYLHLLTTVSLILIWANNYGPEEGSAESNFGKNLK